jgi:hypothetical protein
MTIPAVEVQVQYVRFGYDIDIRRVLSMSNKPLSLGEDALEALRLELVDYHADWRSKADALADEGDRKYHERKEEGR